MASSPFSSRARVQASRSIAVSDSSNQAASTWKSREGKAVETGGFAAPDAVLDAGVRAVADLKVLDGSAAARDGSVGEEDLVAHALVKVEQGELGAGMRALTSHDEAGAVRKSGQVDHAGQLGDLG